MLVIRTFCLWILILAAQAETLTFKLALPLVFTWPGMVAMAGVAVDFVMRVESPPV
jgi:hypothetical protein